MNPRRIIVWCSSIIIKPTIIRVFQPKSHEKYSFSWVDMIYSTQLEHSHKFYFIFVHDNQLWMKWLTFFSKLYLLKSNTVLFRASILERLLTKMYDFKEKWYIFSKCWYLGIFKMKNDVCDRKRYDLFEYSRFFDENIRICIFWY